jgi:hypothetical protein
VGTFSRSRARLLGESHLILTGYQRSIRQIYRSPYIETTTSLPFVGMTGVARCRRQRNLWQAMAPMRRVFGVRAFYSCGRCVLRYAAGRFQLLRYEVSTPGRAIVSLIQLDLRVRHVPHRALVLGWTAPYGITCARMRSSKISNIGAARGEAYSHRY